MSEFDIYSDKWIDAQRDGRLHGAKLEHIRESMNE